MFPFEYESLIIWSKKYGRTHLPWRNFEGLDEAQLGYRVWLAEILLQQTQADRVIGFYTHILEKFPTLGDLAQASYDTFFPYYQGLGYYSRARNLLATAKIVHEKYHDIFPKETDLLRELPGIGPYTAEAIRAFAYNIPTLSFDTNLEKIFARYYHGSRYLPLTREEKREITETFKFPGYSGRLINGAFMDLGGLWSKNQKGLIDFSMSPFQDCIFTQTLGSKEIEPIKSVRHFPLSDAQIWLIIHENHTAYFSSSPDLYLPFQIPSPEGANIRHTLQQIFQEKYQIILSVRPPHKKCFI